MIDANRHDTYAVVRDYTTRVCGWVPWIVVVAVFLLSRLFFFSGFILGDDNSYAEMIHQMLGGRLPVAEDLNVFAARPLLLFFGAGSIRLMGYNEFAFVLPALISSLVIFATLMWMAWHFFGRTTTFFVGIAYSFFGFDLYQATTFTNDIMASAMILAGTACTLAAFSGKSPFLGICGGFFIGAATGVKLLYAVAPLPLSLAAIVFRRIVWRQRGIVFGCVFGLIASHTLLMAYFFWSTGNPLAHLEVEQAFNRAFLLPSIIEQRAEMLWFYPRLMLGPFGDTIVREGFEPLVPFGLLFILGLPTILIELMLGRDRTIRFVLIAITTTGLVWFLILQFWPLTLRPVYCPIHRLDRILYIVALHVVAGLSVACAGLWARSGFMRPVILVVFLLYCWSGLTTARAAKQVHDEFMIDSRATSQLFEMANLPFYTDADLRGYLQFITGYERPLDLRDLRALPAKVHERCLVIIGGSRQPWIDPNLGSNHQVELAGHSWFPILALPGRQNAIRPVTGVVLLILPLQANFKSEGTVTRLDVGDQLSELACSYSISNQTWLGTRELADEDTGRSISLSGRAFRGHQEFYISVPEETSSLIIDKTVDARIGRQRSRWILGGMHSGEMVIDGGAGWKTGRLILPAPPNPTGRPIALREEFVESDFDINAFVIRVAFSGFEASRLTAARDGERDESNE